MTTSRTSPVAGSTTGWANGTVQRVVSGRPRIGAPTTKARASSASRKYGRSAGGHSVGRGQRAQRRADVAAVGRLYGQQGDVGRRQRLLGRQQQRVVGGRRLGRAVGAELRAHGREQRLHVPRALVQAGGHGARRLLRARALRLARLRGALAGAPADEQEERQHRPDDQQHEPPVHPEPVDPRSPHAGVRGRSTIGGGSHRRRGLVGGTRHHGRSIVAGRALVQCGGRATARPPHWVTPWVTPSDTPWVTRCSPTGPAAAGPPAARPLRRPRGRGRGLSRTGPGWAGGVPRSPRVRTGRRRCG
jgi:hypothetical protein